MAEDFDVEEKLEENNDTNNNPWEFAHKKYENGDVKPLEMQYHLKEMDHKEKVEQEVEKKGLNIDYDKFDVSVVSILLTSTSFVWHPLFLSLWGTALYKIIVDSRRKVDNQKKFLERLDDFGLEFFYYIAFTLMTVYFFLSIQNQGIILEQGGTFFTTLWQVIELVQ